VKKIYYVTLVDPMYTYDRADYYFERSEILKDFLSEAKDYISKIAKVYISDDDLYIREIEVDEEEARQRLIYTSAMIVELQHPVQCYYKYTDFFISDDFYLDDEDGEWSEN